MPLWSQVRQASSRDDPRTLAHAIEWQPWDEHADPHQAPDARARSRFSGEPNAARTLRDRLADAGYLPADVAEARCVLYVADPGPVDTAETDIDCAVRLSAEVADLVRRLAERDDDHPATLWIITRGVREAVSDAAVRQSCLWGLAGVIRAEQPQLWGGLVDIPAAGSEATSVIARRRCPRCCGRRPSPSWCCATANSSRPPWCRSPANRCENRCGVAPMRHTSSPAAWAPSVY